MKIRSNHKCIICGGDQIILNNVNLLNLGNRDTVECLNCGTLSRVPFFDNKSLDKYYSSHFFRYSDNIQDQMASEQAIDLYDSIKIQNIDISKIEVLEIGSGNGFFLKNLDKLGFSEARGIEPDGKSVNFGREKLRVNIAKGFVDFEDLEKLPSNCNVIVLLHVIEHLADPIDFMNMLFRKYPNAYFYIEVPDVKFEKKHLELSTFPYSLTAQHLFSFSSKSLRLLFESNKYETIFFRSTGNKDYYSKQIDVLKIKLWVQEQFKNQTDISNSSLFKIASFSIKFCVLFLKKYFLIKLKHIFKHSKSSRQDLPSIRFLFKPI